MRKPFLLLLLLGILLMQAVSVNAQKKKPKKKDTDDDDKLTYSVLHNEPDEVRNFYIAASPLNMDFSGYEFNFGYNVSAGYTFNNLISLNFRYGHSYFDLPATDVDDEGPMPAANGTAFTNLEIGGTYYFKKEDFDTEEKTYLYREGNVRYFTMLPAKAERMLGLRLSYQTLTTQFDGNAYPLTAVLKSNPSVPVTLGNGKSFVAAMNETIIAIGFSKTTVHDLFVNFKRYGNQGSAEHDCYYADLLFAPSITYGDLSVPGKDSLGNLTGNSQVVSVSGPKFPVGVRVGYTFSNLAAFYTQPTIEAGIRPGYSIGGGLYFLIKFDLGLGLKI